MKVLSSYVIYKRLPNEEKTSSGLVLPEIQRYANILAEVVALGPGEFTEDGDLEYMGGLKVGDIVLIDQQSGRPIDKEHEYCDISEATGQGTTMSLQGNNKARGNNLEKRVAREFQAAGIEAERVVRTNFGKSDTDIKIKDRPWIKIDTKSRKKIAHHSLFEEEVIAKYCLNPEDEPIMPSCEKGKRQFYVMIRLPFLLKLLTVYFDYLDGKLVKKEIDGR